MRIVKITAHGPGPRAVLPLRLATCNACLDAFRPTMTAGLMEKTSG